MSKERAESSREVDLPLVPVPALYELLAYFLRQQDSDLRMLQLIEDEAEDFERRDERVTGELLAMYPHLPRASVSGYVQEATSLVKKSLAEGGPIEDRLERGYNLAERLATELTPAIDAAHFAGHLMRTCIDEPDTIRMRGTLLMSAMASLEGYLVAVGRLLGLSDPDALSEPVSDAPSELRAGPTKINFEVATEVEQKIDRLFRGGWKNWNRVFQSRFAIDLPERTPALRDAFALRNAVAHANGSPTYTDADDDAGLPMSAVRPEHASELTANYLRALADTLLLYAAELMFASIARFGQEGREASGKYLANLRFELLLRRRWDAAAATGDLDHVVHFADEQQRRSTQINRWLALKHLGRQRDYMRELDSWGDSARGSVHEVARAVLKSKPHEAARLTDRLRIAGKVSDREWYSWPLFESFREPLES